MSQKFFNIIKPLDTHYPGTIGTIPAPTWGDAIITIQCRDVFLKAESLIENITFIEPKNPTRRTPLETAIGTTNITIPNGIYYLAQYGEYYNYSAVGNTVTLTKKTDIETLQPYEQIAGSYKYNLLELQQFIYNCKNELGVKQVSQNYWKIDVTGELEDVEYFYFQRTWDQLPEEYDINAINQSTAEDKAKRIEKAIREDTTLTSALSALKRAVAKAEFYCTCLPKIDIREGTSDDYNFITFYVRKKSGDVKIELTDYYEQFDLSDYTQGFSIDPQTHVLKLGIKDISQEFTTLGTKRPLPYFVIRDYYRNANGLMIARPAKGIDDEDFPSDIHFQQLMQKVNSTYDFNLPIDPQPTDKMYSVHKSYLYDKIDGRWVEVENLNLRELE